MCHRFENPGQYIISGLKSSGQNGKILTHFARNDMFGILGSQKFRSADYMVTGNEHNFILIITDLGEAPIQAP